MLLFRAFSSSLRALLPISRKHLFPALFFLKYIHSCLSTFKLHYQSPGRFPSRCSSLNTTVFLCESENNCLMLMAARCVVHHLLESLCILMTAGFFEKRETETRRRRAKQMSHHGICWENNRMAHQERRIQIWQWQVHLKPNWLSQPEFIQAVSERPRCLVIIKTREICGASDVLSIFADEHDAKMHSNVATYCN